MDTILGASQMHTYIQIHIPALWEAVVDKILLKIANQSGRFQDKRTQVVNPQIMDFNEILHTGWF